MNQNSKILLVIIFFVYSDIICENYLVIVNNRLSHLFSTLVLFVFLTLQIIFSPLQSGFSDFFGRKKSLVISLSVSFLAIVLAFFYMSNVVGLSLILITSNLIKGLWGNTIPISFAAIADTQKDDYRGSFALSSGIYAIAFVTFILIHHFSLSENVLAYIVGGSLLISIFSCITLFKDAEDKTAYLPYRENQRDKKGLLAQILFVSKKEVSLIIKEISLSLTRKALVSYLLWETSMYIILISEVDLFRGKGLNFALFMMFGYVMGVIFLKLKWVRNIKDRIILKIGYLMSFFSLVPYFILYYFFGDNNVVLGVCYFFHALGNAFLSPTVITILVRGRSSHDQGKLLGLVESSDTVSFFISICIVMILVFFKISLFYLILISFGSFSFSWLFYRGLVIESKKLEQKL